MDATIEQFKSRYNLNGDQVEAITTTEGPVQLIAGPGAGKTLVLILRTLYLLMTGSVRPKVCRQCDFRFYCARKNVRTEGAE